MTRPFADALRARLTAPLPGLEAQLAMAPRPRPGWDPQRLPPGTRDAAGLVLLYAHAGEWHVPLTVRGSRLRHHTGQVSLPGGRVDAGETIEQAALREANEEIGVDGATVEVLGQLTPLHVPVSSHLLHPVVGITERRPDFVVNEAEVDRLLEVPLARLRAGDVVAWYQWQRDGAAALTDVPYFAIDDTRVWGATAMILAEFLAVIAELDATDAAPLAG